MINYASSGMGNVKYINAPHVQNIAAIANNC